MKRKVRILSGMGGEDGKGSVASWLAELLGVPVIARVGGGHGGHRVVWRGKEYLFSQFCSAAWMHVRTFLTRNMLVEPISLLREGEDLKYGFGLHDAFENIAIDRRALFIMPPHGAYGRIHTLVRTDKPRSSVGIGVGTTVRHARAFPDEAIYARDLANPRLLQDKLEAIRVRMLTQVSQIMWRTKVLPRNEQELAEKDFRLLSSEHIVSVVMDFLLELARLVKIVNEDYLAREILMKEQNLLFEVSQGVLLDPLAGFHPHTTKVSVTPQVALELLDECGYDGEVKSYMAMRAYRACNYSGPCPSYDENLTRRLREPMPESFWAGKFRAGYFDEVMTNYAVKAAERVDGIIFTCVDRLPEVVDGAGQLMHCASYTGPKDEDFFDLTPDGRIKGIKFVHGYCDEHLERQQTLGELLFQCSPNLEKVLDIPPGIAPRDLAERFRSIVEERLGVRVVGASIGPTNADKVVFI